MRAYFSKLINDAKWLQSANGWLAVYWAVNFPAVIVVYFFLPDAWKAVSILYLALVSVYANFVGHISSWQASRVEVEQKRVEDERQEKEDALTQKIIDGVNEVTPDK